MSHAGKTLAIAHNGNLTNARRLKGELEARGSIFQTTIDSEVMVHLIARNMHSGLEEAIVKTTRKIEGAYACTFMTEDELIAFRDPSGLRPLCLGKLNGAYVIASETCAFDLIDAKYERDIEPGEIVIINQDGLKSIRTRRHHVRKSFCIFELIYFARPDSSIFGVNVYNVRKKFGEKLAEEYKIDADFAMPFPDSGNYAAIGYCRKSGIPLEMGMIRNHYVGRTFIAPSQSMRDFGVKVKLNPVHGLLEGKKVVIIEDSIIRGTTSKMRIKTLRDSGAKEIHMLVSCPPHRHPCFYGIDFSTKGELLACRNSLDQVKEYIGVDSLGYLSLEGMIEATGLSKDCFCMACFNGEYPIEPDEEFSKLCLENIRLQREANMPEEKRIKELELLYKISTSLNQSLDLKETLYSVLDILSSSLGMIRGTISILNPLRDEISIEVAHGLSRGAIEKGKYKVGEGVTGRVIQSGQSSDSPQDQRRAAVPEPHGHEEKAIRRGAVFYLRAYQEGQPGRGGA